MAKESAVVELSDEACIDFLSGQTFGRLAVVVNGLPEIFPINFALHVGNDAVVAYIRTSPGTKLLAAAIGLPVALEVDEVEESSAKSAIIYGSGRAVSQRYELDRVESLGLTAWIADWKPDVIAIDVERISGRHFALGPGPDTIITESPD